MGREAWPTTRPRWIVLALVIGGAILASLPHAVAWTRSGDWTYIPDGDGLLYLAWSRGVVLDGDLQLSDAIHRPSGPMMHPRLLFVPPAWLARVLGLGMSGLGVVWRVVAGSLMALTLFTAIRPSTRRVGVAVGLAAFLICDPGVMFGQVLRREAEILGSLASGSHKFLTGVPRLMPHFRVVTPGLALPALLLHFAVILRARTSGGPAWRSLAVGSFGLLFYVYFYYWTMVTLGLALALICDRGGRRLYLMVLLGGLALGAPALWDASQAKRSTPIDWLWRTNKFVPIGHFEELLWPKGLIVTWLAVAYPVFRKRSDLIYQWCCTGAGLICLNHQIFTGLQIENDHWSGAYGVTFSLLLAGLVAPLIDRANESGTAWRWAFGGILAAQVAVGFGLRLVEASHSEETLAMHKLYVRWRDDPSFCECPARSVVAGDPDALFLATGLSRILPLWCRLVEFSAKADDIELDQRLILNSFLLGIDRDEMTRRVERPAGTLSWEAAATRSTPMVERQRVRRRALIVSIWTDPGPWIERFDVNWVVLPRDLEPIHLTGLARLNRGGPYYQAWRLIRHEKRPDPDGSHEGNHDLGFIRP